MPELTPYIVRLRHEAADITGRIAVRAESFELAGPVAIAQAIEISYPESVAADWAVLEVLA
jgi:hypothetical protein